jgi:hypothetical protein
LIVSGSTPNPEEIPMLPIEELFLRLVIDCIVDKDRLVMRVNNKDEYASLDATPPGKIYVRAGPSPGEMSEVVVPYILEHLPAEVRRLVQKLGKEALILLERDQRACHEHLKSSPIEEKAGIQKRLATPLGVGKGGRKPSYAPHFDARSDPREADPTFPTNLVKRCIRDRAAFQSVWEQVRSKSDESSVRAGIEQALSPMKEGASQKVIDQVKAYVSETDQSRLGREIPEELLKLCAARSLGSTEGKKAILAAYNAGVEMLKQEYRTLDLKGLDYENELTGEQVINEWNIENEDDN